MPKTFTYQEDGLAYTVVVDLNADGEYQATITVDEGAMDLNAVYFGDSTDDGDSADLGGPLNMNGAGSLLDGETVDWDTAIELSRPGLGTQGEDKPTYLVEGESYVVDLDIDSLDDIDVFGIRATSTTTDSGSIKGVSEEEEPEEELEFNKVAFVGEVDPDTGEPEFAAFIEQEQLGEDSTGSFADYANYFETYSAGEAGVMVSDVETIAFLEVTPVLDDGGNQVLDDEGIPLEQITELFTITAPEDGWADAGEMIAAYDEAIEDGVLDDYEPEDGASLMAALALPPEPEDDGIADLSEYEEEDELEFA